jgi:F-type H+-transporting ATPase subunit gamma
MASLKEIRNRIRSVSSTRKITSAMKMVSAAKLKKAQRAIENSIPYVSKLCSIVNNFITSLDQDQLPLLSEEREVKRVAIIVVSSNSSLCGAFNSNVLKAFIETYRNYRNEKKEIIVYPIGKKVTESIKKLGIKEKECGIDIAHGLNYEDVYAFGEQLMTDFVEKRIDKAVFIHNHFKTAGVQEIQQITLLPFSPASIQENAKPEMNNIDYIIEPSKAELINELLPKVIKLELFSGLQDSLAAEHAARTTAMQIATDNADNLIQELRLNYNKLRQSSITDELITIIGGAEALK